MYEMEDSKLNTILIKLHQKMENDILLVAIP